MKPMIKIEGLAKSFTLHQQGGLELPVFGGIDLTVSRGECAVLLGESGMGKSTLLRAIYANYLAQNGSIHVRHDDEWVDMTRAEPRTILEVRRRTLGYVSQFLRVIPRVPAIDIVTEPLRAQGLTPGQALAQGQELLSLLRIPERLWNLPPATFSGGEQQRVNIARGFITGFPILLLDEPTAALDAANRRTVIELIERAKTSGTAIVGIFHDEEVRQAVGTRFIDLTPYKAA